MISAIRDLVLEYIDEALDIDDLENIGDYIRSVVSAQGFQDWQLTDALRNLHTDLSEVLLLETDRLRKVKIKAALSYFEADLSDFLIAKEIETLTSRNN
jgi:hypothetical protein